MRKVVIISLVMVLGISFLALSNSQGQDHAAARALDLAAYQSALVDRHDLPGVRLPVWGGYVEISQGETCYYRIGWAEPTGLGASAIGYGPGRSNNPENGVGRINIRFWVDGHQVRLNRSGEVDYSKAVTLEGEVIETWFVINSFWVVFPEFYFEPGTYHLECQLDALRIPGIELVALIELQVNP